MSITIKRLKTGETRSFPSLRQFKDWQHDEITRKLKAEGKRINTLNITSDPEGAWLVVDTGERLRVGYKTFTPAAPRAAIVRTERTGAKAFPGLRGFDDNTW